MSRRRLLIAAAVLVSLAIAAISLNAFADQEPTFFVDGARPHVTGEAKNPTDEVPEGCVQYSADRPDVHVCGDTVPANWTPPPLPYHDDTICAAALAWLGNQHGATPDVDTSTCEVLESQSHMWDVVFIGPEGSGNVHVPYDPNGTSDIVAHP